MRERRYSYRDALKVAEFLIDRLVPCCERMTIAGSLRRHKEDVGDIELVLIPKIEIREDPEKLFDYKEVDLFDENLQKLIKDRVIEKRLNEKGSECWGMKNKLARHLLSGIPVDFFSTTESSWWNYLTCRTGPAESNQRVAVAAIEKGWKWTPYGPGFIDEKGRVIPVLRERDVFEFVGLPYQEPENRK